MSESAIKIEKLTKIYEGGFKALDAIDLVIPKGSFFGLLGPNGAGKTTMISFIKQTKASPGLLQTTSKTNEGMRDIFT